jgi:hypothetical protein
MDIYDAVQRVSTKTELADFIDLLQSDYLQNPDSWENPTIERFLDALSAWTRAMDNNRATITETPSWQTFAQMLLVAKTYE